jgi:hypothetical protein
VDCQWPSIRASVFVRLRRDHACVDDYFLSVLSLATRQIRIDADTAKQCLGRFNSSQAVYRLCCRDTVFRLPSFAMVQTDQIAGGNLAIVNLKHVVRYV